ncbi:rhomboid family intramembrane serine protease [Urechidicola sp. KH5]
MAFQNDIKTSFKTATIAEKIIYANVLIFIVTLFAKSFMYEWFALPSVFNNVISKPWSVITYGFLHGNFPHIMFNMIFLYFLGNLFLDFFSKKQFISFYIYGILAGGIAFLLINPSGFLVGASAGLMAIIVGLATKVPQYEVRLALIGGIKLWALAAIYVLVSIANLEGENFGGNIAHLGGALIGFLYTKQLQQGRDIGKWIEVIINSFANLFKPSSSKNKRMKTVYKNPSIKRKPTHKESKLKQQRIDAILDKISKSGYESLSKEEKDFLFQSGK